jgi:hypothetical protein
MVYKPPIRYCSRSAIASARGRRHKIGDTTMPRMLRVMSLVFAVALVQVCGAALAQPMKQIKLTEKQVQSYIAAQKELTAIADKMEGSAAEKPDAKLQGDLETVAKKYGFKDFAEYDDVAANVSMVLSGIDPQTKAFLQPPEAIKKEIEQVTADKTLSEKDKKQVLEELNEALKSTAPIQHASNVELVKKYLDKIEAALR